MSDPAARDTFAPLETVSIGSDQPGQDLVVLLHGFAMTAADLAPFGRSLRLPGLFLFPQGPLHAAPQGRAWWTVDAERRAAALRHGGRDLAQEQPAGLDAACGALDQFLAHCRERYAPRRLIVGGFSQGGMLACTWTLRRSMPVDGLVLMSSSRLNLADWEPRRAGLRGLPVFVSHGTEDQDLAFGAGEQLRDFAQDSGAEVTWVGFNGGHTIPLPVWRALRQFLQPILN